MVHRAKHLSRSVVVLLSPSPAVAHVSQDGGECAARTQEIMKYYFGFILFKNFTNAQKISFLCKTKGCSILFQDLVWGHFITDEDK